MKFACERDKLLSAFQTAATVAPSRSPKPILQNVKLVAEPQESHSVGNRYGSGDSSGRARDSGGDAWQCRFAGRPIWFDFAREY